MLWEGLAIGKELKMTTKVTVDWKLTTHKDIYDYLMKRKYFSCFDT